MRWVCCILPALLAAAPFDPHPLTESQRARLETADDGSTTIDEAALYALLESAANGGLGEAGAVVPDYDAIRREPQAWRGVRCLVEGTLYRVLRPDLGRVGWEKVQGVVVRIDHTREPPIAQDFVVVYLTHPPAWRWLNPRFEEEGIPAEQKARVRLVARFFKTTTFTREGARGKPPEPRTYLTFVGHGLAFTAPPPPLDRDRSFGLPLLLAIGIGLIAFLVWRLKALSGGPVERRPRLQDHLEERQAARAIRGPEDREPEAERLPQDPAQALDALSKPDRSEET